MEYFFDKSLKLFTNTNNSIKVYLSAAHILITDSERRSIRMPIRINRPKHNEKPHKWVYELVKQANIVNVIIKYDNKVHTIIRMDNTNITIIFYDEDKVGKGNFTWSHMIGNQFNTDTNYMVSE